MNMLECFFSNRYAGRAQEVKQQVKTWYDGFTFSSFYHGFVLGLMADRASDYVLCSNRESGLDAMMW